MTEKVVDGFDIKYTLVDIKEDVIPLLKKCDKQHHQIMGYVMVDNDTYAFYSIEDNYKNPIVGHWTANIVRHYDNHSCWLLVKEHPCGLYSIITDMYKNNYVCNVHNFDVWKNDVKNCLIAVITRIEID